MKRNNREYLLIIDGSSLLATSYYATLPKAARKEKDEEKKEQMLEKMLPKNKEGRYINGVRQFFHTLCTILVYQKPTHLAICWDCGKETFRKVLFPPYKSNRRITPQTLRQQYETAFEICQRLRIRQFRSKDYEADDFAGSIAAAMEPHMPVRILTRDKDFFQLITERTAIWYGMADKTAVKEWRRKYSMAHGLPSKVAEIDRRVLWEQFGWTPESITMLKSLSGDVSDNIPGVYGMGELRSLKLALHYTHPDELYADIDAASTPKGRKDLAALWRSWGIRKNPYPCLTSRGSKTRQSARSMAYLCYTLGKIRTDLELKANNRLCRPSDFCVAFSSEQAIRVLGQYGIRIQLRQNGRKKDKPVPVQTAEKHPVKPASQKTAVREASKQPASKPAGKKDSRSPASVKTAQQKQKAQSVTNQPKRQAQRSSKPASAPVSNHAAAVHGKGQSSHKQANLRSGSQQAARTQTSQNQKSAASSCSSSRKNLEQHSQKSSSRKGNQRNPHHGNRAGQPVSQPVNIQSAALVCM